MIARLLAPLTHLLEERDVELVLVDVGARNGIGELPHLAPFVRAVGFEPNPAEFDKLVSGETDVARRLGIRPLPYREVRYLPYACGRAEGRAAFHVTPGPGAAGMLEPDLERLGEIVWKGRSFPDSLADEIYRGFETIEVAVRRLDDVAEELELDHVDYLKVDVEGYEHDVLVGARELLPRVGVIRVETFFVPLLKAQKLFSDVDVLLREHGFELLRYEIDPAQIAYKARTSPVEAIHDRRFPDPHGQAIAADAIYVNRAVRDPDRVLAQAAVLLERDYVDEALHLLRKGNAVSDEKFLSLLANVQIDGPSVRLRAAGYRTVDRAVAVAQRGAQALRRLRSWRG